MYQFCKLRPKGTKSDDTVTLKPTEAKKMLKTANGNEVLKIGHLGTFDTVFNTVKTLNNGTCMSEQTV